VILKGHSLKVIEGLELALNLTVTFHLRHPPIHENNIRGI